MREALTVTQAVALDEIRGVRRAMVIRSSWKGSDNP